ncbi:MAG: hypothetical protein HOP09_08740 [Hyphomicrobium sp.]|nr:hypothetical protein [Hyphomicrobium sp.]
MTRAAPAMHRSAAKPARLSAALTARTLIAAAALSLGAAVPAAAQTAAPPVADWNAGVEVKKSPAAAAKPANTTVIERAGDGKSGTAGSGGQLRLVALLTADGQQIDQGLVWRVYQNASDPAAKAKLIAENRDASPTLKLPPGDYTINASFGRAHITRKVSLKPNTPALEQFILNAGGLRLNAHVAGKPAPPGMVTYSIFTDDRDQFANRTAVMAGAKPNLIMRLNAGIYRLVSTYGDANARVETDVTVEAGKLTEANVVHAAGKATFSLVTRAGGEALPDTHWTVIAANGDTVKESVGALPTHMLAPGKYTVTAKWGGQIFQSEFAVKDAETVTVEVLNDNASAIPATGPGTGPATGVIEPSLEIKNP